MAAFLHVFGDIRLINSQITSGCCAEGLPELIMSAKHVGFVMDRVVTAVRRGSSLLLF
jgi:hypothetical protein